MRDRSLPVHDKHPVILATLSILLVLAVLAGYIGQQRRHQATVRDLECAVVALEVDIDVQKAVNHSYRERLAAYEASLTALAGKLEETECELSAVKEDNATLVAKVKAAQARAATTPSRAASPTSSRATAPTAGWSSAKASWYGPGFYGKRTASGATLTQGMMNVAHKSLPFGTRIQFEYNGKTATAVVNDRGPFIAGRTFDLGPGTAQALGFSGVGTVRYRIVGR